MAIYVVVQIQVVKTNTEIHCFKEIFPVIGKVGQKILGISIIFSNRLVGAYPGIIFLQ